MRFVIPALTLATLLSLASAPPSNTAPTQALDVRALGDSVAGSGPILVRTRRLVYWINDNFDWSATDYQKRTPAEIIERRAGNCAELASVLHLFLESLDVRTRWVHEINVQPEPTPSRQRTAERLVAERGKSLSVFGLQHNDHVWLEVWDDSTSTWFPADPAYGVAGLDEWLPARLAMESRPKPRVDAIQPIAADMLVPFALLAGDRRRGPYDDDRTTFYVVDGFRHLYGDAIVELPSWPSWVEDVTNLAPHARAAFADDEDLHDYTQAIASLKDVYDSLVREAAERRLTWHRRPSGADPADQEE